MVIWSANSINVTVPPALLLGLLVYGYATGVFSSRKLERATYDSVAFRAIFCQKSIAAKIVERGGDYVFPVKDNQKTLRQDIETAFNEPVFPPVLME